MTGQAVTVAYATTALLGVLAMIVVGARLLRNTGWTPRPLPGKRLSLRESVALDTRRRLHLVRCGERDVLLLTGGAQDVVVGWLANDGGAP
jgi:flagellar protein FliO/FliZ